jgi:hypothetical protein
LIELVGKMEQELEVIFNSLYRHLDVEKLPVRETLLISIGSMGR